jgi:ribosomal protein L40E
VKHVYALAALAERLGDVERARDEYLASLDADDGLAVLLVPAEEIEAAIATKRVRPVCRRCGARLARKRHRCSRCGLAAQ